MWTELTLSDLITLLGVLVTLVSMAVSIHQARSALKSSQAATTAMSTVQIIAVAERLKSAQEHIRDLAVEKVSLRGFKLGSRFDLIRREFDQALGALPKVGKGGEARLLLTDAQKELNNYQTSLAATPDSESWQKLQSLVQDAISDLTSENSKVGVPK